MNEDIKQIMDENGVDKVSFYFISSPIVNNAFTTCVFLNTKQRRIEARGVSICSLLDTFCKSEGKNKAFGRAMKALLRKENDWKINGSGRDVELVSRSVKIKNQSDDDHFRSVIAEELKRIDPTMEVRVISNGSSNKKYLFKIPTSYPIKLANTLYRYKSQYRPPASGTEEFELINKMSLFTEPIEMPEQ